MGQEILLLPHAVLTPRAARSRFTPAGPGRCSPCPGRWRCAHLRPLGGVAIVFGMPTNFHYGTAWAPNPIQMMQACPPRLIRHRRIMSDRCVFIVSPICGRLLPRRALALPGWSCTTCSSTTTEHPPHMKPVRRVLRHQGGVHPASTALPPSTLPLLLHDELGGHSG